MYGGTINYGMSTGYTSQTYTGQTQNYGGTAGYSNNAVHQNHPQYQQPETPHFSFAETFLAENRPLTPIISKLGDVKEIIEQTYNMITEQEFPHDSIKIIVLEPNEFKITHEMLGGHYTPGIMGFSYNRYGKGISEIYIKQDHMDSLLLTIGHEIGHVLSPTLNNAHDEEAKAHAFSLTWMETIRDNNIGGLQPNITPNPAHNGLHDTAFDFVKYLLHTGSTSYDIFKTLSTGLTSIIARG